MYSELQKREPRKDNSKVTLWFPLELKIVWEEIERDYAYRPPRAKHNLV